MKVAHCQILGIHWSTKRATQEGLVQATLSLNPPNNVRVSI